MQCKPTVGAAGNGAVDRPDVLGVPYRSSPTVAEKVDVCEPFLQTRPWTIVTMAE